MKLSNGYELTEADLIQIAAHVAMANSREHWKSLVESSMIGALENWMFRAVAAINDIPIHRSTLEKWDKDVERHLSQFRKRFSRTTSTKFDKLKAFEEVAPSVLNDANRKMFYANRKIKEISKQTPKNPISPEKLQEFIQMFRDDAERLA